MSQLIHSVRLDYCGIVHGNRYKTLLQQLQVAQNTAIGTMLCMKKKSIEAKAFALHFYK